MTKRKSITISNRITDRSSGTFKKYLADLTDIPLFTSEEECECAKKAVNGDQQAKADLVTHNLRFVVSIAKVYVKNGVDLEDLINEGNIGLIEAADRFDPTMGNKFITYAVWYIRRKILAYVNSSTDIKLPINKRGAIDKLKKRLSLKEQELCRPVTYEDLIDDATSISEITILEDLINVSNIKVTSIDIPLDLGDGTGSLYDIIPDDIFGPTDKLVAGEDIRKIITKAIENLKPLHQRVMIKRYGLDGNPIMTLAECSHDPDINVSRERVRQIEKIALRELKNNIGRHSLELI